MKRIFYIMILCYGIAFSQNWTYKGTMPEPVLSGAEAVAVDSVIYVLGGFSESNNSSVNDIRIYTPGSNNWQNKTNMKEERSYFVSGIYNDSIFFFGGITGNNEEANTLEMWNRIGKTKTYSSDNVFNRRNSSGVILNNIFYFFGGSSTVSNYHYLVEYDIMTNFVRYYDSSPFTIAPAQQMCASDGNYIYLFGGVFQGISKSIYRYNPADRTFIKLNVTLQTARAGGRAVLLDNNKIFIIGGYNETQNALSSTEIFTINNGLYSISSGPSLMAPRKNFMAPKLNGIIYVMGGKDSSDQVVNKIEVFNTLTSVGNYNSTIPGNWLLENYPNPFNPATTISFSIAERSHIILKVFNELGEEVAQLINKEFLPGIYKEIFNADERGLSSGVYFYSLSVNGSVRTRKMILLK